MVPDQQGSDDERTGGFRWALEWENLVLPGYNGKMAYKGRHNPYGLLTKCRIDTVGLYGRAWSDLKETLTVYLSAVMILTGIGGQETGIGLEGLNGLVKGGPDLLTARRCTACHGTKQPLLAADWA
jgi:hypothetical protein